MGGYARSAQDAEETALQAQIATLRAAVGPEAHAMPFDKFACGHDVYGWRAFHDARYRSANGGAVPVGPSAISIRCAFVSHWYKSVASQDERDIIDSDFRDYKVGLRRSHTCNPSLTR
jgi:hypothetical protein